MLLGIEKWIACVVEIRDIQYTNMYIVYIPGMDKHVKLINGFLFELPVSGILCGFE
jgi:hypothetical protein